jgi:hypothetical protein
MATKQNQSSEPITVHGLVIPAEWDEQGRAITLSIATFNEDEYIVDEEARNRLLDSLGKEVLISGVVQEIGKKKCLRHCSILKIKANSLQPLRESGFVEENALIMLVLISLILWITYFLV